MSWRVSQTGGHVGKGKAAAIRNAKSRAKGRIDGESDIAILLPRGGFGSLLLEHKAFEGYRKVTDEQEEYINYHNSNGNCAAATKGIETAKAAIVQYMGME